MDFYIEAAANPDIGKYFWSPMPLGDKATSGEGRRCIGWVMSTSRCET
ncbi:putative alpha-mannosidase domain protein [Mycobacteroides abscessus]|nr:putative alpha-mannosidase domain protein [Mycobacteroides abscessus]